MKKLILLLSIIALFCQITFAQTGGLNFQGVARNASGAVLANQKINLRFSILKTTETGAVEYTEIKEVTTNAQGIFAVVVGEVNATSFAAVDWKASPKFLKVEMDATGGTSFITMGTTRLQNVPFAYYANGVNANNIDGAVPVSKGGTGATDAATARNNLGLVIGTNVQAPLTAGTDYLTPAGSAATLTNFPTLNQNTTGNAATATKLAAAKKINGVNFDGSSDITITTAADASTLSGTVSIAKGGTGATNAADARANLGLVIGTNIQAPLVAGTDYLTPTGSAARLTGFPTLNQNTTGNAATATKLSTARNINGVAFDGSADITVAADASTLSGTVSIAKGGTGLTTVGTAGQVLTSTGSGTLTWTTIAAGNVADAGTLSGTVAIAKGGTGATNAAAARTNLGLVIGTNVQAPLIAGTDYLTPTGSAAGLSSFPILNQNTTGNAATATLAGNITATSNATLTALPNLNSVGTISSGVWSGTVVSVAKGGTGTSTLSGLVIGNGSSAMTGIIGTNYGEILNWNGFNWVVTGTGKLAIGNNSGAISQGINNVAIGYFAGNSNQANFSVAMGEFAGKINQGGSAVSVGPGSGENYQGYGATAIGRNSGALNQGTNSVSIGNNSGKNVQGSRSIAMGLNAAFDSQGENSIAIGIEAAAERQGNGAIAIGSEAGLYDQGTNSIAIGAYAGVNNQPANSIILNSSGTVLNASNSGFYVMPIRMSNDFNQNTLTYDRLTGEIVENSGKTFVINHPTKSENYLVHAAIEGPEAGVYYRGEAKIENNKSVIVSLPDYVSAFANNFTIQITPIYEDDEDNNLVLRTSRVKNNSFTVYGKNTSFYWVVYGQRGSVEVEPKKSEVELRGDGPYKYLLKKK